MLILFEHVEYFKWKALSPGELVVEDDAPMQGSVSNALVAFTTVLFEDAANGDSSKLLRKAARKIYAFARKVNAETVVIYPFAHLTNREMAQPRVAVNALREIESELAKQNPWLKVVRTPFGWHKQREARGAFCNWSAS